jgi:hypothetical protein
MTGLFTSSSCNSCNLRKNHRKREAREEERIREEPERDALGYTHMELEEIDHYHIPVIMHNLKDYDSHFIIRSITKEVIEKANGAYNNVHMNAINSKSLLSFDVNYRQFIDSLQFLKASLDTLVRNLEKSLQDYELFVHTRQHTCGNTLLFSKSVYCYEWFDFLDKLKEKLLPPIEAFHSKLNDECISEADYKHTIKVWNECNCKTLKDYHDMYMKCDV